MRASLLSVCAWWLAMWPAWVAGTQAGTVDGDLRLKQAQIEPKPSSGRYTVRARFAAEEAGGELREGGDFVLIGRIAKGGVVCTPLDAIFDDGFESP
jgi:hypothetical protein